MNAETTAARPIGVFDSGVGGLSVLHEIRRELPNEDLLYVADSGHAPYGDKSAQVIEERSIAIVEFLISQHAQAIVVACNTATGVAIKTLRTRFWIPIIAMEPAVKPAAAHTRSGVIGVLATSRTIASDNFAKLHERFGADVKILMQACPGLVEQVEAGNMSGDKTRALVEQYGPKNPKFKSFINDEFTRVCSGRLVMIVRGCSAENGRRTFQSGNCCSSMSAFHNCEITSRVVSDPALLQKRSVPARLPVDSKSALASLRRSSRAIAAEGSMTVTVAPAISRISGARNG